MKTVDRRNFLRGAAVAMAATSGSAAANGKIRAGILGTQHSHVRGKLRAMRNSPDYEVVSVCEPEEEYRRTCRLRRLIDIDPDHLDTVNFKARGRRWKRLKRVQGDRGYHEEFGNPDNDYGDR